MEKLMSLNLIKDDIINNKEEVSEGLNSEYSKNNTICGFLNNIYEHLSNEYSEKTFYQFYYNKRMYDNLNRSVKIPSVSYSNDNWIFQNKMFESIYINLINMHPCYDDKGNIKNLSDVNLKIRNFCNGFKYAPSFYSNSNFIYANLSRNSDFSYNSESKKVYLDVGYENFDRLFEDILKLYCDTRSRVDRGHLNSHFTDMNEFKMRPGYASDGIVFRFFRNSHYEIFKERLSGYKNILQALRSSNPFLPVDYIDWHPINVIPDMGGSFNDFVANVSMIYISRCIENDDEVSVKDFLKFMKNNIVSMNNIDPAHYKTGIYDDYRKIVIEQVEKQITK